MGRVSAFKPNKTAINNLVMNESHLRMVRILTERYNGQQDDRNAAWSADFIQSKGEGQIFLLHGPPGVGKTYTVECIAETSGRLFLQGGSGTRHNDTGQGGLYSL